MFCLYGNNANTMPAYRFCPIQPILIGNSNENNKKKSFMLCRKWLNSSSWHSRTPFTYAMWTIRFCWVIITIDEYYITETVEWQWKMDAALSLIKYQAQFVCSKIPTNGVERQKLVPMTVHNILDLANIFSEAGDDRPDSSSYLTIITRIQKTA